TKRERSLRADRVASATPDAADRIEFQRTAPFLPIAPPTPLGRDSSCRPASRAQRFIRVCQVHSQPGLHSIGPTRECASPLAASILRPTPVEGDCSRSLEK